jgi:hypothetical protein
MYRSRWHGFKSFMRDLAFGFLIAVVVSIAAFILGAILTIGKIKHI